MDIEHNEDGDLLLGVASGLAAGLVGALVMTGFQSLLARGGITSGVKGPPSTEKAANRAARLVTGRPVPARRREVAGEAVHYVTGSLVGGVHGAAAEIQPCVTAGKGTAFGVAAATVVDETLVPIFRFGDPVWRAPVQSHPYSYASHLIYGAFTEAARKGFRRFFGKVKAGAAYLRETGWSARAALLSGPEGSRPGVSLSASGHPTARHAGGDVDHISGSNADSTADAAAAPIARAVPVPGARASRQTLLLAFMLGATAGPRTSAPLLAASWAARLGLISLKGSPLAFLGKTAAVAVTTPMAVGELVVDKLPSTPDRTQPVGVVARVTSGALSGTALAGGRSCSAGLAGAAGAIVATYVGHAIRTRVSRAIGHDAAVAVTEDLLAFGGAAMVCVAALAPERPEASRTAPTPGIPERPLLDPSIGA